MIPPFVESVNCDVSSANVQYPNTPIITNVINTKKNVLLKTLFIPKYFNKIFLTILTRFILFFIRG